LTNSVIDNMHWFIKSKTVDQ